MRKFQNISGRFWRARVKRNNGQVVFSYPSSYATPSVRTRWGRFLRG